MELYSALKGVRETLIRNLISHLPLPTGDLTDQVIIVSGANTGLGYEAVKHMAHLNASKLILTCRSIEKGESAKQRLVESTGRTADVFEVWQLDMSSYGSVGTFVDRAQSLSRIDALLANAGFSSDEFEVLEDNESMMTVNVVSTFLLIFMMLPKLRSSAVRYDIVPRISVVGSGGHFFVPFKELECHEDSQRGIMETLNGKETANMGVRYFMTKLLVLFAIREMDARMNPEKESVIVNCPNPSFCVSGLQKNPTAGFKAFEKIFAYSTEEGSRALVNGVMSGKESRGQYLSGCRVKQ